jgi:glycosyltransferase involved in cell wall biosynthesis
MLSEQLTIVIPCKNEQGYISNLLHSIVMQYDIKGTRIIIADSSDDDTPHVISDFKDRYKDTVNIEVIEGGLVSKARNNGAFLVKTPYVLFLDADVQFKNNFHLIQAYYIARKTKAKQNQVLITSKLGSYSSDWRCGFAYGIYNFIHSIFTKKYPFAIGAFFFTDIDSFRANGRFDEYIDNSEDFLFSQNYKPSEFIILKDKILMDDRRFKKIGYLGFAKHLIVNFFKFITGNKDHFKKDVGYWG